MAAMFTYALEKPGIQTNPWLNRGVYIAFWTLLGILLTGRTYYSYIFYGVHIPLSEAAFWEMTSCYIYAILTPFVISLTRRHRFEREKLIYSLGIHFPAAFVFALIHSFLVRTCAWLIWSDQTLALSALFNEEFVRLVLKNIHFDVLVYWLIVGTGYAFDYYKRYQERELRMAQLGNQLYAAQLQVLRSQIHPHFLFNTLHTVSSLIYQDVNLADKVITRLSELLRMTLENASLQFVQLSQEIDFLKMYLDIMKTRFQNKLEITMNIDADTTDAIVPYLILQPLVENAIKYGKSQDTPITRITISSSREKNMLRLDVADNGPGLKNKDGSVFDKGIGLSNTSKRLIQLYGSEHRFILQHKKEGGLVVTLMFPAEHEGRMHQHQQGSTTDED